MDMSSLILHSSIYLLKWKVKWTINYNICLGGILNKYYSTHFPLKDLLKWKVEWKNEKNN